MKYLLITAFTSSLLIIGSCSDAKPEAKQPNYSSQHGNPCEPHCGRNETYSTCANGGCFGAIYCSEKGAPEKCARPKHCYQGCICKKGYLRDDNTGDCILEAECPASCSGDINARPGCGTNCGRHCSDFQYYQGIGIQQRPCPLYCLIGGCDCKPGYLFDDYLGKCVAPVDCTKCHGPNEVYDYCPSSTSQTCASLAMKDTCTEPSECIPQCRCIEGYYRDEFGTCVPESECQCKKDPNAVHGCGVNCGRWCKDIDSTEPVACLAICYVDGCDCKEGYFYDEVIDRCVLPHECSRYKCVGDHEIYVPCPDCSPQTCDTIGREYDCPWIPPKDCKGECRCEQGYRRNSIGQCITEEECHRCTGPHEYYSCGGACDNVCKILSRQNQTNCPYINVKCNEMCYCEEGFARDENGICIPISECPQEPCCGPNAHHDPCPPRCTPETCESIGKEEECPIGPAVCIPACRCNDGYFRDNDGLCILKLDCPQTPCSNNTNTCNRDPNAVPGCGANCFTCSNYDSEDGVSCAQGCTSDACQCKKGYVFDETIGLCVHPKECNRHKCPNPNEVFDPCLQTCPPRQCGIDPAAVLCLAQVTCEAGCRCADGYLRNEQGLCIKESECQCHEDPNAVRGCGVNCGRWCKDIDAGPVSCIEICYENSCDCKEGYYYDEVIGLCVLPQDCSRYKCGGAHEIYVPCPDCTPDTCDAIGKEYHCPLMSTKDCKGECRCEPGYRRNSIGQCITEEECLRCTGPHEYYSCGGACDNVCKILSRQNQTNCPYINVKCNEMCYCEEGFARDENGICIPISECPQEPCCGPNAHHDPCPPRCTPETCESIGKEEECPIGPAVCIPACRCNDGYFRDHDGQCIPKHDCPQTPCSNNTNSCNLDPNAEPGCGINCGRLCKNYNSNETIYCTLQCQSNACDCKKGYVLDETIGLCVHPKECNRYRCPNQNEVFEECLEKCPPRECGVDPSLVRCPENVPCESGCRCADGYLRNEQGLCVWGSDCPDPICNGENEILDPCFNGGCFGPRHCYEFGRPVICVDLLEGYCQKGCICKEGYLRNEEGCCVPEEQCPQKCHGDHEEYSTCMNQASSGPRTCSEKNDPQFCENSKYPKDTCEAGCVCQKGYLRNEHGDCVPECECTPKKKSHNH